VILRANEWVANFYSLRLVKRPSIKLRFGEACGEESAAFLLRFWVMRRAMPPALPVDAGDEMLDKFFSHLIP